MVCRTTLGVTRSGRSVTSLMLREVVASRSSTATASISSVIRSAALGPAERRARRRLASCCSRLADAGASSLELRCAALRPHLDVLVEDLDHLADRLRGDQRPSDDIHHTGVEFVGANVRPSAPCRAAVVAVGAGVGARHRRAARTTEKLRECVTARIALRWEAVLTPPDEHVLDALPELVWAVRDHGQHARRDDRRRRRASCQTRWHEALHA